jgi:glutamate-1-semialdehyde 2,1-aminomutase
MKNNWTFNSADRLLAGQLSDFIPDKVFDIHAHLYSTKDMNLSASNIWNEGPPDISINVWSEKMKEITGDKNVTGGLFFPAPSPDADISGSNKYLISQLAGERSSRGLALVSPVMSPGELEVIIQQPSIVGMKPYFFFSSGNFKGESSITDFFPEWQMEIADQHHSVVMMHLVKRKAVSDPENIKDIINLCLKYPGIRLILAHAARSFHSPNAGGIKELRGLQNIWFDTSAICEPEALLLILREFGPRRIMWGSDFPISQLRGRSITLGDGFAWIDDSLADFGKLTHSEPVLAGLESIRALKIASDEFGLIKEDIRDIFFNNAQSLIFGNTVRESVTQDLYRHAKDRIPGGVQLLSKRPENMAPDHWPPYFSEARGCEVWDLDSRHFYDMVSNGIGACLLGYADPDVNAAVRRRVNLGSMCTLNPPEEVHLADLLCELHPWAHQTRFARCGGEICAVAVRIARATTNRSLVAVCGYHGWHDWYLAANLGESDSLRGHLLPGLDPLGVPSELRGTTITFRYNDRQNFMDIIKAYGSRLAAVIMEPCRDHDPEPGFLELVREETVKNGALLIFDEITIGWRMNCGGVHMNLGVFPDMAVFAKALGNGYPIGAVIGTKEAMDGANGSFISSTYWTESIGPAASLATVRKMIDLDIPAHVAMIGGTIMNSWKTLGEKHNLPVISDGYPALAHFRFAHDEAEKLRTIYTQLMLDRGFLGGTSIYPTLAHTLPIAGLYHKAIDEVFGLISGELHNGSVDKLLKGRIALSGFARLT